MTQLTAPVGVSQVYDDLGNLIPVVAGKVSVEPHLVAGFLAAGFTAATVDANATDAQPVMVDSLSTE